MADNRERFAAPPKPQPTWRPDQPASAEKLNTVADTVDALIGVGYVPQQNFVRQNGTFRSRAMIISGIFPDYIVCKEIEKAPPAPPPQNPGDQAPAEEETPPEETGDPDIGGRIMAAKPPLFQRTLYEGKVRNNIKFAWNDDIKDGGERTATDRGDSIEDTSDDTEEIQVIVPSYQVGDMIYIEHGVLTGVTAEAEGTTIHIEWIDKNNDGRAWARKKSQALGADE